MEKINEAEWDHIRARSHLSSMCQFDDPRDKSIHAAIDKVLEMRDRGHEALTVQQRNAVTTELSYIGFTLPEITAFWKAYDKGLKAALTLAAPEPPAGPLPARIEDHLSHLRHVPGYTTAQPPVPARQSATMDDEVRHAPPPADGQLVEVALGWRVEIGSILLRHRQGRVDDQHAFVEITDIVDAQLTAAMQVCLSSRNLVALPDVDKAIRDTWMLWETTAVWTVEVFLSKVCARLKPEPAKPERVTPEKRVEEIIHRALSRAEGWTEQIQHAAAEIVAEIAEKGRAE